MAEEDSLYSELHTNPLRIASIQLNELYKELSSVGFSKREALFLVGQVLISGVLDMVDNTDRADYYEDEEDNNDNEDGFEDGDFS